MNDEYADLAAQRVVSHLIKRIRQDGRLAYLLGDGTESYDLLTSAYAALRGLDVVKFRREFALMLNPMPVAYQYDLDAANKKIEQFERHILAVPIEA